MSLATLERRTYPHGTHAAYAHGCRCNRCRGAHAAYAFQRREARRRRALKAGQLGNAPAGPGDQCPGVRGRPCAEKVRLRASSAGGVCRHCRALATSEGWVPAGDARAHLERLSKAGIGRPSVEAVSGVSRRSLSAIRRGDSKHVRARVARAILDVDESCRADGAHVPAEGTRKAVAWLLEHGYSRTQICFEIGAHPKSPLAQGERVTVRTADRVRRLYEHAQARVHGATRACPRCHISHEDDPIAAEWCKQHPAAPLTREERLT